MKIITHKDIIELNISPGMCLQWVEEMIANKSSTMLPPKISLKPFEGAFCNVMPVLLNKDGGVKVVTRFPNRIPALDSKLLLLDIKTGDIKALVDANWITAMRTGAVAAHSIKLLAVKNFEQIGIIGLGNTARATFLCLSELVKDREIKVKLLKHNGQEEMFKDKFKGCNNFKFEFVDSYIEAIENSDVVLSAVTYFKNDICPNKYFKEGVTVIPVHTRGFSNCDLFFDKIYADDKGHVCNFKYFDKFKHFAEIADILTGKDLGRENNKQRILVYNIGVAMHDINFASKIYAMLEEKSLQEIDLKEPCEKFWI